MSNRRVLAVIMDGIGESTEKFGNAVRNAFTPNLDWLKANCHYRTIYAHGTYVGLPSNSDIGNSEVGHNALGAGKVFDQGSKLVTKAIENRSIFATSTWQTIKKRCTSRSNATLHFLGLLSDGNVHSHEEHLYRLIESAVQDGIHNIRIHVLFDGRDVGEKTAEVYINRLEQHITRLNKGGVSIKVASAGGRMILTMDRYNADWSMVERGWNTHVKAEGRIFPSLSLALKALRSETDVGDQYLPPVVIGEDSKGNGPILDGDSVVLFNFRGDRAIEISRAFTEANFTEFARGPLGDVFFAGMMQYDGDLKIPEHYLVSPPEIKNTLGEILAKRGKRQFACSETQKFGHVTYFWNGNKSGYFNEALEEYLEVPSDNIRFDLKPWMKAFEICEETIKRMSSQSFDFGRINFANGDMVGHTGNYQASQIAVEIVDLMIGRLIEAAKKHNFILIVTADHGNADEMFDAKASDFPEQWQSHLLERSPNPKTSHTLSPVPLIIFDPQGKESWKLTDMKSAGLPNVANTILTLMGSPTENDFEPSLIEAT
jgi:2,3-bisphosphoglycerate-independent phosphoglycerate mutase